MQAADKKRSKEEKDIGHRLRPFARLQTAADYEAFVESVHRTTASILLDNDDY
jgi:transcriptional adapter 2-alpha